MYAISVKQPWAQAIAQFGKSVENRSRRPPAHLLGQRVAIHVSQSRDDWQWMRDGTERFHDHRFDLYLWAAHGEGHTSKVVPHAGRIVATALLVGYIFREPVPATRRELEEIELEDDAESVTYVWCDGAYEATVKDAWLDSPWFTGPVGWVLADVRALREPVGRMCSACLEDLAEPTCNQAIRGQVFPFALPPEVEAAVLAQEAA